MSQIVNKAESLEEKEKWKQAAQEFQKAFSAFEEEGKTKEAKNAILKAVENIRKTDEIELTLEILEDYTRTYQKKTKAVYITDIIQE
jgi:outer membrane protein assembly factor BamD (BamD/ComL family)